MYILDNSLNQWVFHVRTSTCPSYIYLRAGFNVAAEPQLCRSLWNFLIGRTPKKTKRA